MLLRIICCDGLVVLSSWLANVKFKDERDTTGVGAMPVPVKPIVSGLPEASSVIVMDALRLPVAVGVNVTVTVQLAPEAKLAPQELDCVKSPGFAPVSAMLAMFTAVGRLFVSVTF